MLWCQFVLRVCVNSLNVVFQWMLWFLTPLSTIFQLYRGGKFYWWRKPEFPEKTTDLSLVTDKRYLIMLHRVHFVWARFELTTVVFQSTDMTQAIKLKLNYIFIISVLNSNSTSQFKILNKMCYYLFPYF